MLKTLTFICLLFTSTLWSQQYADSEFYLVDSLEYDKIAPNYQKFIDDCLTAYHQADTDMERITWVNQIVKSCWDENVWPKYNKWVHDYTKEKLKKPHKQSVTLQMKQALAGALYYIGWNYGVEAKYELCLDAYEQCLVIYEETNDSIGIANALDNIGTVYATKGETAKALELHQKSADIRSLIQDINGMGASLNNVGIIYMEQGDYINAQKAFEEALEIHLKTQFFSGIAADLSNLGTIAYHQAHYEDALDYHSRSLYIKEEMGDKQGMAISLIHVGLNANMLEDTSATSYYQNSLELFTEVGDQKGISEALSSLGRDAALNNNYDKATEYYTQALRIAKETGAAMAVRISLVGMYELNVQNNNFDSAESLLIELIQMRINDVNVNFAVLPEQKKEKYFGLMTHDFGKLYSFAVVRKDENPKIVEAAFNMALKVKGLSLKSTTAMREAILSSTNEELINQYAAWIKLKEEIAALYASGGQTDEIEIEANALESQLIKNSTIFNDFSKTNNLSWKEVKTTLAENETAIEFVQFNSEIGNFWSPIHYAALIINSESESPKMITLCSEAELEEVLGITQNNNLKYISELYGTKESKNTKLYDLIWKPIEAELANKNTVYFSPTGLLHKVAFSALRSNNNSYLSDHLNIIQLGSTGQIVNQVPFNFDQNSTATLFGGINYDSENSDHKIWEYLPGTLSEVDSIYNSIENIIDVKKITKDEATETAFKEVVSQSNYLHIATHGFFYPDPEIIRKEMNRPEDEDVLTFRGGDNGYSIWNFVNNKNPLMRSGIVLAGANEIWDRGAFDLGEDGVLTAQEVANLNLRNTDLVVLSACETGLGDIKGSEGVYGLQRAFKMAGARYLIMSLWQVPDKETAEFMTLFYQELLLKKDVRLAFASTQKEMRAKYDPYFWAAFVLVE